MAKTRAHGFGRVKGPDGKLWAGAHVMLVSQPVCAVEFESPDVVQATANGLGRFGAELRPHVPYSCWAWKQSSPGNYRVTAAESFVFAGRGVALAATKAVHPKLRVRLVNDRDWARERPFRLRIPLPDVTLTVTTAGSEFAVPPLPGGKVRIDVIGKSGRRVASRIISLTKPAKVADGTLHEIDLGYRCGFLAEAEEFPKSLPVGVPSASVYELLGGRRTFLGRTKANGRAAIELPFPANVDALLLVEHPDFRSEFEWVRPKPPGAGLGSKQFVLNRAGWRHGKVLLGGKPLASQRLILRLVGGGVDSTSYATSTDELGRYVIPPNAPLTTVLTDDQIQRLTNKDHARLHPVALLGPTVKQSNIDLGELARVELTVRGTREDINRALLEFSYGTIRFATVRPDARGRASLLVLKGRAVSIKATRVSGYLRELVIVRSNPLRLDLELDYADVFVTGVLKWPDGTAAAGVDIRLAPVIDRRKPGVAPKVAALRAQKEAVKLASLRARWKTDAAGRFKIPVFQNHTYRIASATHKLIVTCKPRLVVGKSVVLEAHVRKRK